MFTPDQNGAVSLAAALERAEQMYQRYLDLSKSSSLSHVHILHPSGGMETPMDQTEPPQADTPQRSCS